MYLAGFVLCNLVLGVLLAVLALAVRPPCLRNVDLRTKNCQPCIRLLCAFEPKSNPLLNSPVSIVSRLETISVTIDVRRFWGLRCRKVGNMPDIQIDMKCGSLRVLGCGSSGSWWHSFYSIHFDSSKAQQALRRAALHHMYPLLRPSHCPYFQFTR